MLWLPRLLCWRVELPRPWLPKAPPLDGRLEDGRLALGREAPDEGRVLADGLLWPTPPPDGLLLPIPVDGRLPAPPVRLFPQPFRSGLFSRALPLALLPTRALSKALLFWYP